MTPKNSKRKDCKNRQAANISSAENMVFHEGSG